MLPAPARLRSSAEFAFAFRGRRVQHGHVVAHLAIQPDRARRVGLSVSKAVGNAVTRHSVARRLRHVMASRLHRLPEGSRFVIRALPSAALATSAQFAGDIDIVLAELTKA